MSSDDPTMTVSQCEKVVRLPWFCSQHAKIDLLGKNNGLKCR